MLKSLAPASIKPYQWLATAFGGPRRVAPNTIHCCDWLELLEPLPARSVDLLLTDMPYGTTYCVWDSVIDLDRFWIEVNRVIKPTGAVVCTASQPFTTTLGASNQRQLRAEIIWLKGKGTNFLNANRQPFKAHENILIFSPGQFVFNPQMVKGDPYIRPSSSKVSEVIRSPHIASFKTYNDTGDRYPLSYVYFPIERGLHPTQKPVPLFEYLIETFTNPGALVVDPFAGSGTTAVAAWQTGRNYIVGDQDEEYVGIMRDRLQPTFGKRPQRQKKDIQNTFDDLPLFQIRP